jgi:hypothetical protein
MVPEAPILSREGAVDFTPSLRGEASIENEYRADGEAGLVRGEIKNSCSDLLRPAQTPNREPVRRFCT